jgi:MFS family permease
MADTLLAGPGQLPEPVDRPLMENRDFLKVWSGETISLIGTQVTQLALPLVAIYTLQASAFDVGVLNASRYLPVVIISLFAGVWLDRRRRRPILIASNLGRAVLTGLIPLTNAFGMLSMWLLCLLCVVIGTLTVIFDVGLLSYMPGLVERRHLTEANSKLQTSWSLAGIVGPGLGGLLIGLISAPVTMTLDAVSFLLSGLTLIAVRRPEAEPAQAADRTPMGQSIKEGLSTVFGSVLLRALLTQSAVFNLFYNAMTTVFVVYAVRYLGLSALQLGLVVGSMSLGALAGAFTNRRITHRFGLGRMLRINTIFVALAPLLIAVPHGHGPRTMAILMLAQLLYGVNLVIYNVNTVTLRQIVTPNRLLARMNASYRLLLFGTVPIGALFGGLLGEVFGLRTAMVVTVFTMLSPIAWTFFSPVFQLTAMPEPAAEDEAEVAPAEEPVPAVVAEALPAGVELAEQLGDEPTAVAAGDVL